MEIMLDLANYNYVCWGTRSSPSQVLTALLTTALIIGLNYHLKKRIPTLDGLLKVTITPLRVLLTMERSTRFILRIVQVSTKHHLIVRSGLSANTQAWYCTSTCSL